MLDARVLVEPENSWDINSDRKGIVVVVLAERGIEAEAADLESMPVETDADVDGCASFADGTRGTDVFKEEV